MPDVNPMGLKPLIVALDLGNDLLDGCRLRNSWSVPTLKPQNVPIFVAMHHYKLRLHVPLAHRKCGDLSEPFAINVEIAPIREGDGVVHEGVCQDSASIEVARRNVRNHRERLTPC